MSLCVAQQACTGPRLGLHTAKLRSWCRHQTAGILCRHQLIIRYLCLIEAQSWPAPGLEGPVYSCTRSANVQGCCNAQTHIA
jgi:hypothetical protein